MMRTASLGLVVACALPLPARAQDTVRISVDSTGAEADNGSNSVDHSVAFDGKDTLIVFDSFATNLVTGDKNGKRDVFLREVAAGTTTRIVLDVRGGEPDGDSVQPRITPDGRYVVFESDATDLVQSDGNGERDVFVLDRKSGLIERASLDENGAESDDFSGDGGISDDGQRVVFTSLSGHLTSKDSNGAIDVFLRDFGSKSTVCVSHAPSGATGNSSSFVADITAKGTTIVFASRASDLVANDGNSRVDIFGYDVSSGAVSRVSVNEGGFELDADSGHPSISADGALIAFETAATNLHRDSTAGIGQIYVRELATGEAWLASRGVDGAAADETCLLPLIFTRTDATGAHPLVAFWSSATNLPDDGADDQDAFVFDFRTGLGQCVTVDSNGVDQHSGSTVGSIAATPAGDGMAFLSIEPLVTGDGNSRDDVFLRGLQWTALSEFGSGLAGSGGFVPHLTGRGGSCEAGRWDLALADGLGRTAGHLWVGFGRTSGSKLFGGTFYVDFAQPFFPIPIVLDGIAGVGGTGDLFIDGVDLDNVGQFSLFLQATLLDARAPKGVSLSNALEIAIDA